MDATTTTGVMQSTNKREGRYTQFWRDNDAPDLVGEGITRTSDPDAGFYWVEVIMRGAAPLASCVRARSPEQAVQFCQARHPNAVLTRLMEGQ